MSKSIIIEGEASDVTKTAAGKEEEPLRAERCENCQLAAFPKTSPVFGECRAKPPQTLILPLNVSNLGQVQTTTISAWPPVRRNQWCGDFKAKLSS